MISIFQVNNVVILEENSFVKDQTKWDNGDVRITQQQYQILLDHFKNASNSIGQAQMNQVGSIPIDMGHQSQNLSPIGNIHTSNKSILNK